MSTKRGGRPVGVNVESKGEGCGNTEVVPATQGQKTSSQPLQLSEEVDIEKIAMRFELRFVFFFALLCVVGVSAPTPHSL